MDIFIKWYTKKGKIKSIQLPILPESYTINGKQQNTSVNIHDSGELNLKGKRALMSVGWSCFFPGKKYDFAHTAYAEPLKTYVKVIETLLEDNTTVQVIIGSRLNLHATIESFSWGESGGSGDIEYDISFKEYRVAGDNTRIDKLAHAKATIRVAWYKGDTWKKICKRGLGSNDADLVEKNRAANKKLIDKAIATYRKKHKIKKTKTVKETDALDNCVVTLKYDFG